MLKKTSWRLEMLYYTLLRIFCGMQNVSLVCIGKYDQFVAILCAVNINGNAMTILGDMTSYIMKHRAYVAVCDTTMVHCHQTTGAPIVLQLRSLKLQFDTNQGDFYHTTMAT